MTQTRTVKFMVTREEVWFPEYDVPAHMTDDEAVDYIKAEVSDYMFDEYLHKYTYDAETHVSVVTDEEGDERLMHVADEVRRLCTVRRGTAGGRCVRAVKRLHEREEYVLMATYTRARNVEEHLDVIREFESNIPRNRDTWEARVCPVLRSAKRHRPGSGGQQRRNSHGITGEARVSDRWLRPRVG